MCLYYRKPHKRYHCKSFISEFRIKSCGIYPPVPAWEHFLPLFLWTVSKVVGIYPPPGKYLVDILENLLFHVLSNYACKFAINIFPITWGPFQNVNLLYFLLKIQISNGCNVLNIAGNPIKDITVNLSFLCSGSKVVQNIPCQAGYLVEILENLLFHVLSNYACKFAINLFPIT